MSIKAKHHQPIVYRVYEELKHHVGAENAISADDLCDKFDELCIDFSNPVGQWRNCVLYSTSKKRRKLRTIIREIRRSGELEKVIGSCKNGYYVCTKDDAQKAIDRLMNAAKNMFKTAYVMAKKVGLDGQMKIQYSKYISDTYHSLMENDDVQQE